MSNEEINETKMNHMCCALCDNKKCVRGTKDCEFEQWKRKNRVDKKDD